MPGLPSPLTRIAVAAAAFALGATVLAGVQAAPASATTTGVTPRVSAVSAPLPAGVEPSVRSTAAAISCPTAGVCAAVGTYVTGTDTDHPMLDVLSGGSWHAVAVPLPFGASAASLLAVSCPSTTSCYAVGNAAVSSPSDQQGFALALVAGTVGSGTWQAVRTPDHIALTSLDCAAPGHCVAAGSDTAALLPAYLVLDGTTVTSSHGGTLPADLGVFSDAGVRCPTAGWCVAPGSYTTDRSHGYAQIWSQGRWTLTTVPAPPGVPDAAVTVDDVSCPTAGTCVATGTYSTGSYRDGTLTVVPMYSTLAGTRWTSTTTPLPAGAATPQRYNGEAVRHAVSCATTQDCAAVGDYVTPYDPAHPTAPTQHDYLDTYRGARTPQIRAHALPAAPLSAGDIACPQPGRCAITTSRLTGSGSTTHSVASVTVLWDGSLTTVPVPAPASSGTDAATSAGVLSCPAGGTFCGAVGSVGVTSSDTGDHALLISVSP